jgi:hypothetical protein
MAHNMFKFKHNIIAKYGLNKDTKYTRKKLILFYSQHEISLGLHTITHYPWWSIDEKMNSFCEN